MACPNFFTSTYQAAKNHPVRTQQVFHVLLGIGTLIAYLTGENSNSYIAKYAEITAAVTAAAGALFVPFVMRCLAECCDRNKAQKSSSFIAFAHAMGTAAFSMLFGVVFCAQSPGTENDSQRYFISFPIMASIGLLAVKAITIGIFRSERCTQRCASPDSQEHIPLNGPSSTGV